MLKSMMAIWISAFVLNAQAGEIANSNITAEAQLLSSAEKGDLKKVKSLIKDKKVNINFQGDQKMTALMEAVTMGQMDVVKFLLSKKADLEIKNEVGDTALAMAVSNEQLEIADYLIKKGAKLDVSCGGEGNTLLMCATQVNDVKLIKLILKKHPLEIKKKNKEGEDALSLAKILGTPETKKALGLK